MTHTRRHSNSDHAHRVGIDEYRYHSWNIYYKDIFNVDPLWHLYNDFVDAPVFKTKRAAKEYVDSHKDEFDGCEIQIKRYRNCV